MELNFYLFGCADLDEGSDFEFSATQSRVAVEIRTGELSKADVRTPVEMNPFYLPPVEVNHLI